MFEREYFAGWGDMDFNAHMRNTAFLDRSGDVRMLFFDAKGFSADAFARLQIGPVVMKDETVYRAEIRLLEAYRVSLSLAGMSEDGSRFIIQNHFTRADGKLAAVVKSWGGWLDLKSRKLREPPPNCSRPCSPSTAARTSSSSRAASGSLRLEGL